MTRRQKQLQQQRDAMYRKRFGYTRLEILEIKGVVCSICNSEKDLTVDHIDGNGRNSEKPNNNINNLRILCRKCHGIIDRKRRTNYPYPFWLEQYRFRKKEVK